MKIIDSAVRLKSENGRLSVKDCFTQLEKAGVVHAVIAPSDEFVTIYNEAGNEQILALVKRFPEKLTGLAVANPWYGRQAVELLEKSFAAGLRGLYLHPQRQGFLLTETILHPLIEVCRRHEKPVYAHTGTPVCSMPFQLASLARRFPEVSFVMGHAAWSDFSGYDVFPAAQQAKNVFVEVSCCWGGLVTKLVEQLDPGRVLFGSGYPRSNPLVEVHKLKALGLDAEVEKQIFCGNAMKLWKLKP
jgi:predicted TIM-barrel fold metal-dependent hydrolase